MRRTVIPAALVLACVATLAAQRPPRTRPRPLYTNNTLVPVDGSPRSIIPRHRRATT
jgi:hypothetical protein